MKYLLQTNAAPHDTDVDMVCVVKLDQRDRDSLIRRKAMFKALKKYDEDLMYIAFTCFLPSVYETRNLQAPLDTLNDTFECLALNTEPLPLEGERIDVSMCLIYDDGIYWTFYRKHDKFEYRTCRLSWDTLDA